MATLRAAAIALLLFTVGCNRGGAERANELAAESDQLWERREIQEAMLRAVEAYQAAPTNAALRALANALQNDRQLEVILDGGADATAAVAFSPKGDRLAGGGDDGAIRLWDAKSWKLLRTMDADGERVTALAFTPDGGRLFSGDGALIRQWDPATGQESGPPLDAKRGDVEALAMHPGGRWLAAGYAGGAMVWDLAQQPPPGVPLAVRASQRVDALAFDGDGDRMAVIEGGKTLKAGDFNDGVFSGFSEATLRVEAAAVSMVPQSIAVGFSDGGVLRFQDYTMFPDRAPIHHKSPVRAVALEPKGVYLASGSDDGRVLVTYGWQEPVPFKIRDGVRAIAWDPVVRRFAVATDGPSLYVLNPTSLQPLARVEPVFPGQTPKAAADAVSPDGKRRARVNGRDANVTLIETGQPGAVTFRGVCPRVLSVGFVGERLVTGCEDGSLELLDPAERTSIVRLPDHDPGYEKHVDVLAVRGGSVATGSRNGRVLLWDLDPQSWMRRACRRAGTDAKPCRPQ